MNESLTPDFINPFFQATLETLKITCGVQAQALAPFIKTSNEASGFELAATLGIVSPTFCGTFSILFTRASLLEVVRGWLGEDIKVLEEDHEDGCTELLNIIFGSAKVVLNERGYHLEKALPTLLKGTSISTATSKTRKTLVVPFQISSGIFHVELSANPASKMTTAA